jgi:UDP-N-acetylglucosamine 4-epimerase
MHLSTRVFRSYASTIFSTGKATKYIQHLINNPRFSLIEGDIREPNDCAKAAHGADFVLHQAALGSVPRSINDPATSNNVNVGGFVNMLVAARDAGIKTLRLCGKFIDLWRL